MRRRRGCRTATGAPGSPSRCPCSQDGPMRWRASRLIGPDGSFILDGESDHRRIRRRNDNLQRRGAPAEANRPVHGPVSTASRRPSPTTRIRASPNTPFRRSWPSASPTSPFGYEDVSDHDHLRHDPVPGLLAGKLKGTCKDRATLARKSTQPARTRTRREPGRGHGISYDPEALQNRLTELFIASRPGPPRRPRPRYRLHR